MKFTDLEKLRFDDLFNLPPDEPIRVKRLSIWQATSHSEEISNGRFIVSIPEFMPIEEAVRAIRGKGYEAGQISDWYFVEEG